MKYTLTFLAFVGLLAGCATPYEPVFYGGTYIRGYQGEVRSENEVAFVVVKWSDHIVQLDRIDAATEAVVSTIFLDDLDAKEALWREAYPDSDGSEGRTYEKPRYFELLPGEYRVEIHTSVSSYHCSRKIVRGPDTDKQCKREGGEVTFRTRRAFAKDRIDVESGRFYEIRIDTNVRLKYGRTVLEDRTDDITAFTKQRWQERRVDESVQYRFNIAPNLVE